MSKFEGGNAVIIWERFSDQSIKNWICGVFVGFPWQICEFSLPFLKLFLVLIFVKEILSKKTWICDKYRCFFVRLNAPLLYVVQHFATRASSLLLSDFWRPIFQVLAVTKLVERCFICDLALVSSSEVACANWNGIKTP